MRLLRPVNPRLIVFAMLVAFCLLNRLLAQSTPTAETKALAFLQREVPAWKQTNGCFSCHNNGDAVRALFAAQQQGYSIPTEAFTDTINWLRAPEHWEENKGDPGFSDKRLASLQFAAALLSAIDAGQVKDLAPLHLAARKLIAEQSPDGTWKIDAGNTLGSPATWGTPLATWMAWRVLQKAGLPEIIAARQKAERAIQAMKPQTVPTAAILLLMFADATEQTVRTKREESLQFLLRAQTRDGGWGPYADAPPECFDTAVVLLALNQTRSQTELSNVIQRGRVYLISQQSPDGSWPATTRPSGGTSYAQMMSTTGWVTLALLATKTEKR
ncbi:MAG: hypothetical protein JST84_29165 [Acidobacteria bacterium]|nr:hypothetical protein [Acidobacteriota bacterium]